MIDPNNHTWQCPNCNEQVDDTLEVCWQCGCSRTGVTDPDFEPAVYNKLVNHQDQAICNRCGYLLRGLTDRHCPECGEEFDLFKGDTIAQPALPDTHPINKKRKVYLLIWVLSWLFVPPLVALIEILIFEYHFNKTFFGGLAILLGILFFTTPILFGLSLLPEKSGKSQG
jgi:uncharacterized membrane protein YvbJ